jgi:metal-sulfur cluster biosynthetic enzyme
MAKLPRHFLPKGKPETPARKVTEDQVRLALAGVHDPELGASLLDLNMVRAIEIAGSRVTVKLVLTAPDCPLAAFIAMQTRQAVAGLDGVQDVDVQILDEPWDPGDGGRFDDWLDHAFGRRG